MKINVLIKQICNTALMSALIFVATYFISIPYFGGIGYFNLSECLIIFSTIYFGPFVGILSGIIGCGLGDLAAGFANFIPFTIVAKGLEALLAFILYKILKDHKYLKYLSFFTPFIAMVLTYFVSYIILYGIEYALNSTLFDVVQGVIGGAVGLVLYKLFSSTYLKRYQYFVNK